ncbi:MAG: cytochrome c-type biogenesis protein CcmH [Anaerolineales bacterium]|nr:cytochrome c-type biogenesis protein CcmH [Anaerolineales bacterium]
MRLKIWFSILALLALTLVFNRAAVAQDATPRVPTDDEVNAIAKQMYCPVCENTPLDVCPTQACAEWRELIRDKLAEGWTEEQIRAYFVEQFGARVLAAPPASGLNWLIYIIPPATFVVGVFILYRAFRAWRKPAVALSVELKEIETVRAQDEYIDRLEDELRKL